METSWCPRKMVSYDPVNISASFVSKLGMWDKLPHIIVSVFHLFVLLYSFQCSDVLTKFFFSPLLLHRLQRVSAL